MVLFVGNTQSNHLSEELAQRLYPLYPAVTHQGTSHSYGYSFWLTLLVILLNIVTAVIITIFQKARKQWKQEQKKPMEYAPRDGILFWILYPHLVVRSTLLYASSPSSNWLACLGDWQVKCRPVWLSFCDSFCISWHYVLHNWCTLEKGFFPWGWGRWTRKLSSPCSVQSSRMIVSLWTLLTWSQALR